MCSAGLTVPFTKDGSVLIKLMGADDLFTLTAMSMRASGIRTRQRARASTLIKMALVMKDNSFKINNMEEALKCGQMARVTQVTISKG